MGGPPGGDDVKIGKSLLLCSMVGVLHDAKNATKFNISHEIISPLWNHFSRSAALVEYHHLFQSVD
jgi:hypothetical protein